MNRKSPSIYVRIKMKYFRLILKGVKILELRESRLKNLLIQNYKYIKNNTDNTLYHQNTSYLLQNDIKIQIYNKYKIWIFAIVFSYSLFYFKHNYLQPVYIFNKLIFIFRNMKLETNQIY